MNQVYETATQQQQQQQQRRSWAGRLRDRLKPCRSSGDARDVLGAPSDDWMIDEWLQSAKLHEGHHIKPVPSLQGSVFVAANFVYDYRQKHAAGVDPVLWSPTTPPPAPITYSAPCKSTTRCRSAWDFQNGRHSEVAADARDAAKSGAVRRTVSDSRRVDVGDIGGGISIVFPEPQMTSDHHPQTTVAIDRPGLLVSGQRICILTGHEPEKQDCYSQVNNHAHVDQDAHDAQDGHVASARDAQDGHVAARIESCGSAEKGHVTRLVLGSSLEPFERSCPLRRSFSDRQNHRTPPGSMAGRRSPSQQRVSLLSFFENPSAFDEEDPPAPAMASATPPVAPPRRIFRYSKADLETLGRHLSAAKTSKSCQSPGTTVETPPATPATPETPVGACRTTPLRGTMISWTAWAGREAGQPAASAASSSTTGHFATFPRQHEASSGVGGACHGSVKAPTKRRPVSRLWPSFSNFGRPDYQTIRGSENPEQPPRQQVREPPDQEHEENIYEEIDDGDQDDQDDNLAFQSRFGRSSFAGASRQDILRYLEQVRNKKDHFTNSTDPDNGVGPSDDAPATTVASTASTPSLPQMLPSSDDYEDEDMATMGALLHAMRHNGPNRHSNRSNASSSQSSEENGAVVITCQVPYISSYFFLNRFLK